MKKSILHVGNTCWLKFVNTSKNIAKFKSFKEDEPVVEGDAIAGTDEFGFVTDADESCELCEDKVKHFSHAKRLSSIANDEDFFESHLSEKRMVVDSERHLKLSRLEKNMYSRTDEMLKNSEKHVQCDCHDDGHFCHNDNCECEDDDCCDDVKVDMKTALISETYFNRKRKKNIR